jgi:citrate lyase beta subunit
MAIRDPDLRRTWIFGPGADRAVHVAMIDSGADALIVDLEDFTPPQRRGEARELLEHFVQHCRMRQRVAAIRINALEADGMVDLAAAMRARPDVIAYPMSASAAQMHALHTAISHWEGPPLLSLRTAPKFFQFVKPRWELSMSALLPPQARASAAHC